MNTKTTIHLLILTLAIACSSKESAEENVIGLNEGIRHDDFKYMVTDYTVEKKIGEGTEAREAVGNFYIVYFKVVNEAMRVKHEWDNSVAYITDEDGHIYENNEEAQQLLENVHPFGWQEKYATEHQASQSTVFVFDVPPKVKQPYLMVRGETLMGDFFDGGKFRRTKVKMFK